MSEEEQRLACLALAVYQNRDSLTGEVQMKKTLVDAKKIWVFLVSGKVE